MRRGLVGPIYLEENDFCPKVILTVLVRSAKVPLNRAAKPKAYLTYTWWGSSAYREF